MTTKLHTAAASLVFLLFLAAPHAFAAQNAKLAIGEHVGLVNGMRFHYVIAGHGPLLIVQAPGWGIGSAYLENGLAPLQKHFTLLVFDPRGSGGSSSVLSTDRLTNSDLVEDLEHLRNYWGLETIDLVAHSNGSAIAILYAESYPTRVRKLVLIGSQLLGYTGSDNPARAAERARRKRDPQFTYYLSHINDPEPKTDAAFTQYFKERAGFYVYNPSKDVPSFLKSMTGSMSASVHQAFLESPPASQAPPIADLRKITAETLIIEGRQDPVCPLDESEKIQVGITKSKMVVIDMSGHFPWIEQPEMFFPAVSEFLAN